SRDRLGVPPVADLRSRRLRADDRGIVILDVSVTEPTDPGNVTGDGVAHHGIGHVITFGRVQPSWSEELVEASSNRRPHFHVAIRTTSLLPTPEFQSREGP